MNALPDKLPEGSFNKVGCVIACPTSGRLISPDMIVSMGLQAAPTHFSLGWLSVRGLPVERAREHLVEEALRVKAKYLWFIDDDTIPPPNTLRRLAYVLDNYPDIKAIGGVYVTKSDPSQPVVFRGSGLGSYWQWKYGDIFEVTSMGTGCMLINTDVFQHLEKPWFKFTNVESNDAAIPGQLTSEDVGFCNAVRAAGFRVFAHGGILCDHFDASTGRYYSMPADSYPLRPETTSLANPLILEDSQESQK